MWERMGIFVFRAVFVGGACMVVDMMTGNFGLFESIIVGVFASAGTMCIDGIVRVSRDIGEYYGK